MKNVLSAQGPRVIPSFGLKMFALRVPVTQPSGSLERLQLPSGFNILSLTEKSN